MTPRSVPAPATWKPFPPHLVEGSVHGAFEAQVDVRPDELALAGPGGTLTYRRFDETANRVARWLIDQGAGGRPVALVMAHDVDLVVAIFAVLKAGAIVLILDPQASTEINRAIVADADPAALIVDDTGSPTGEALADLVATRSWGEVSVTGSTERPAVTVGPDDPAMLAYSSGTTGGAKAAVLGHRALLHLGRGATDVLKLGPGDRLPMLFPVSMAVAAYPMILPFLVGGSLHVYDARSNLLVGFVEFLAEHRITVLYISPTVARFMGEVPEGTDLSAVRVVVLGGERVDADAVGIVRRAFGDHVTLVNGYGTTETGVLTFHVVGRDETFGPLGVPVGRPIAETELLIVGDDGRSLSPGEVGELMVRSRYMFSGYWHHAELDSAVLSLDDGVALYRTGDVGVLDDGGELMLMGRSDTEVKVRGHRVIPGEIEQALLSVDAVADAVVESRPDAMGTNELVAWVVPAEGHDLASVRAGAREVIRAPLMPARMLLVEELPLLPNGKLDRRALPDPGTDRRDSRTAPAVPRTPMEGRVGAIWEEILGVRPLGVDDDLEDLGAQSFDWAWALVQVEERLDVRVPMSAMLGVRTVSQLAGVVDAHRTRTAPVRSVVEVQAGSHDRPPLYIVHDLHGTAYGLRHLAPALGADQPVWGFESPYLEGIGGVASSLEELAGRYVTELRDLQPVGPYHLAGYSFGGVLAFEIASQLVAAGESVPFLGVVDVGPGYRGRHYNPDKMLDKPWSRIPMPPDRSMPLGERARWYRDFARRSPRELVYHLSLLTGADRWLDPLQFRLDLRRHGVVPAHRRLWYAWRRHWELARRYEWSDRRYPGPLTLIWADESAATDGTMGWGRVVEDGLEIIHVDILHERMLQPEEARTLGALLRRALDAVLDGSPKELT